MKHFSLARPQHLFAAIVLVLCGFGAPAFADSHKPESRPEKHMQDDGMEQHGKMADELNLNDKQRDLFRAAMGKKMQSMRSGMELHEQLRELSQSDNYDENKARELARKHCADMEKNMLNDSKSMNDFYKSLSAEQKVKLKEMHKNKSAKMKEHMQGHMGKKDRAKHGGSNEDDDQDNSEHKH